MEEKEKETAYVQSGLFRQVSILSSGEFLRFIIRMISKQQYSDFRLGNFVRAEMTHAS